ncbi:hypothetical protein H1R16_01850 [Marnyiella aurantia]|uniref:Uncharacterized protein n=1 Tax=Marnyiella aurantia TaxID=2758037 RepID=A0A7D7LQ42_9FLAO|nr:hypothetical protein [Marnyiella aurantia]MBA5245818.1 hypothetical protein [Marnyiella aurantia]MBP0611518.1 hypothetical protein [Marnyiella aurantia]QMS98780.1 hypothetical protein H1R16_01850 [Marnyiella aurantia]
MMGNLQDHLLTLQEEHQLVATYKENNYALINAERPEDAPDTLECSFELSVVQSFLDYVKSHAEHQGISDVRITVCFGQYPVSNFSSRLNTKYNGQQTVFLRGDDGSQPNWTRIEGIDALDYSNICPPNF